MQLELLLTRRDERVDVEVTCSRAKMMPRIFGRERLHLDPITAGAHGDEGPDLSLVAGKGWVPGRLAGHPLDRPSDLDICAVLAISQFREYGDDRPCDQYGIQGSPPRKVTATVMTSK